MNWFKRCTYPRYSMGEACNARVPVENPLTSTRNKLSIRACKRSGGIHGPSTVESRHCQSPAATRGGQGNQRCCRTSRSSLPTIGQPLPRTTGHRDFVRLLRPAARALIRLVQGMGPADRFRRTGGGHGYLPSRFAEAFSSASISR